MGNQDAPKAPAGWYPIGEGKTGERYWDGENWTGSLRGTKEETPKPSKTPIKKNILIVAIVGFSSFLFLLAVLGIFAGAYSQPEPFITSDEEACSEISKAIGVINEENYGSVAGITEENDITYNIPRAAHAGAGTGAFENTGNKAEDAGLISSLATLAENWSFGSDLINYNIGQTPKYDPNYSMYKSKVDLDKVIEVCAQLGFPLANNALNFDIPEVAAPAGESSQNQQKSSIPAGYSDTGVGIAYMKVDGECDYLRCVTYQVLAYENCPNGVYLEGNQVDQNGVIYGYSNDSNAGMNAGDTAIMTLRATNDNATGIKITDASCY